MNDVGVLSGLCNEAVLKGPRVERYRGHLDDNDGQEAYGWAYDAERLGGPVEVECFVGERHFTTVTADQWRGDLAEIGLSNHAFRFRVPPNPDGPLTVRIKDSDFILHGCPMNPRRSPVEQRPQQRAIGLVAGDIVNQCNLRCPFCLVDYSGIGSVQLMTAGTFAKAAKLMAMMEPGNFWLSCLHEPTLHPRFIDFIEAVPEQLRNRISFTTNLAKRLPDEFFSRLAASGVHHIRVSFDSRQPEVFAELRTKGKYEVFERNLLRLCAALKAVDHAPFLHLITMAFTNNYREIPDIVRFGREIGASSHEVRFVFYMPHIMEWGRQHLLSPEQWNELETALAPLKSPTLTIAGMSEFQRQQFEEGAALDGYQAPEAPFGGQVTNPPVPEAEQIGRLIPNEPLTLRLRWDGLMVLDRIPEQAFTVNVNSLDDPAAYFETMRAAAVK